MQKLVACKWLKVCVIFCVLAVSVGLNGCGSTSSLPAFDINGSKWFLFYTTKTSSGEAGPDLFSFTQSSGDSTITGVAPPSQALNGSINGFNIVFDWVAVDNSTPTYTGSFNSDGSIMSGSWTSTSGQAGTWIAVIDLTPAVDITGKWDVTPVGMPGDQGPDLFTFTQSVNSIAGTTSQGQQITGATGSFSLIFSWVESDGSTTVYSGSVNISVTNMSGTWTNTNGLSGTWSATKAG